MKNIKEIKIEINEKNLIILDIEILKNKYNILKEELKELAKNIKNDKLILKKPHSYTSANIQSELHSKKCIYRIKFISYCMIKGTPYSKIEINPKAENKSFEFDNKIKNFIIKFFTEKDL